MFWPQVLPSSVGVPAVFGTVLFSKLTREAVVLLAPDYGIRRLEVAWTGAEWGPVNNNTSLLEAGLTGNTFFVEICEKIWRNAGVVCEEGSRAACLASGEKRGVGRRLQDYLVEQKTQTLTILGHSAGGSVAIALAALALTDVAFHKRANLKPEKIYTFVSGARSPLRLESKNSLATLFRKQIIALRNSHDFVNYPPGDADGPEGSPIGTVLPFTADYAVAREIWNHPNAPLDAATIPRHEVLYRNWLFRVFEKAVAGKREPPSGPARSGDPNSAAMTVLGDIGAVVSLGGREFARGSKEKALRAVAAIAITGTIRIFLKRIVATRFTGGRGFSQGIFSGKCCWGNGVGENARSFAQHGA